MVQDIEDLHSPLFSTYLVAGYEAIERPVPETTPKRYLSGMTTLCLPCPWTNFSDGQNNGPDHLYCFKDHPNPLPVWGEGEEFLKNTLHIYDDYGIHNYSEILYNAGFEHNYDTVYGADHYRAICDIVYANIVGCSPKAAKTLSLFTMWIVAESIGDIKESMIVLDKISMIEPFLSNEKKVLLHKWLQQEEKNIRFGSIF